MSPHPGCGQRAALLEGIRVAMSAIIALNNREMEAVMSGNLDDLEPIQADLRQQRQIKENLLHAYQTHVKSHGC
jgi:hypothetical protein